MPIRPSERARYPSDWKAISLRIRERSGGRCECSGECGLHRTNPGPRRCEERNGEPAKWARGKVVLTVAHLDHTPERNDETPPPGGNLRAYCQRCHNRYDREHRQSNAAMTRRAKSRQQYLPLVTP